MKFYNTDTPDVDDIVMCQVDRIQDYCIYVKLLEYNNIEGMVQLADASTRRKRKSVCLLKENKKYPLLVIRVDKTNKYIDLSNKFLSNEDKEAAVEKFNNYFFVVKILKRFLSNKFSNKYDNEKYINYAEKTIWKIQPKKCYEYLIDNYLNNNNYNEFDISQEEKDSFRNILEESLGEVNFTSTLNFMARNANFDGVSKMKEVFQKILDEYQAEVIINVAPNYYLKLDSTSNQENINKINEIECKLSKYMSSSNCLYKKIDVQTINNIS